MLIKGSCTTGSFHWKKGSTTLETDMEGIERHGLLGRMEMVIKEIENKISLILQINPNELQNLPRK